jgi:hypothetical protein
MFKLFILLFASVVAVQAHAADLIITCDVTAIEKDGTKLTHKKRYEIDLEPHYFKTFIDGGTGFQKNGDGFPYSINEVRITFVNDGTTSEYYDRKTSKYFYQNSATGLEANGNCTQADKSN